jgi:hypothetical protein
MEEDSSASYVVQCIGQYDASHENKLSIELQGLVLLSEEHVNLCLQASVFEMTKKVQRDVVMDLLTLAIPSTKDQQPLTYGIGTSNALFVYMLEKYARIKEKGIPTRFFKMTADWNYIFQSTSRTTPRKPLTYNGSFVFLENFRDFVDYPKAPVIYQVIKETIHHYQNLKGQKSRRDLQKHNKRKYEDFLRSELVKDSSVQDSEVGSYVTIFYL